MAVELSRRQLIIGILATISGNSLGCIKIPPLKTEINLAPTATPTNESATFLRNRSLFSSEIINHNLAPEVLPQNQWAYDRMKAGVDYLKKAANAFEVNPKEFTQLTAESIGIVGIDRFPIALATIDTPLDIIKSLLRDIADRRVIIWGGSMSNVPYLIGTINYPKYIPITGWYMEGQIHANAGFPFGPPQTEESNIVYNNYTDLQVGLKMAHEYSHILQGRQLLKLVLAEQASEIISHNNEETFVMSLINTRVDRTLQTMNADNKIDRNYVIGKIAFNEAQANLVAQSILWSLNKLNGKRMPGTQDDRYPTTPASLFQTFKRAILQDNNQYDPYWLYLHANWQ